MALVNLNEILYPALAGKYAVGAFNTFNEDFTDAILRSAEANKSPVIVSFSEVQLEYVDLECLAAIVKNKAAKMSVPVVLHLDHGMTFDTIMKACKYGFTSVMFDGSSLSFEENVRRSAEIVKICHPMGISVEAELGAVGGDEGGLLESQADSDLFTNVDQANEFVQRTGVDALAVAIGNAHGKYKFEPKLDFDRLAALNDVTTIPLVLHGGSGISDDDFRKVVSMGISKINFFTGMLLAAIESTKSTVGKCGTQYNDYLNILAEVKQSVAKIVADRMDVFGSVNKSVER